jgi:hypothetical protein
MTKVEYICASHREANRKLREWLDGMCRRLDGKSHVLGWLFRVAAWIVIGVVYLVSWLAFVVTLFRDVRFTLHFMECEIGEMPPEEARAYLIGRQQEYTRRLSYGSVSVKEQKRIDKTFEYLFSKYPAPASLTEEDLPDLAAERHTQVMGGITEVRTAMDSVAGYTSRKDREDAEREKKEAEALAIAEKRRQQHLSKSGFEPHPKDFSPKLSDRQIAVLAERMNEIGVFRRDVTAEEITRLLLCEHTEPLQTTHNKMVALILEKLCAEGFITPKWQRVAADKKCFISKMGKPLTAKDLSSAKQAAELIPEKKYEKILDCIEAVKRAR